MARLPTILPVLWERTITRHLRWIDDHAEMPPGRVSAETRCALVYLVAAVALTLMSYGVLSSQLQAAVARSVLDLVGAVSPGLRGALRPYEVLGEHLTWALGCFTLYFAVPALVVRRVFGHRLADYGLGTRGFVRHLWVYALLFVPVAVLVWVVARDPDFQRTYPFYRHPRGLADFVVWECLYALQFFSLEFFFRGFMLHGVKDRLGRWAIFAMVVPYTMIHFSKPMYETLGAVVAGLVLGTLSLRTRNVWGGFLVHVAVAVSMDVAAMAMR
ncbi:MAG: CPBP family intramembrane glutamic endopeptidase [Myxococcota bacterium]